MKRRTFIGTSAAALAGAALLPAPVAAAEPIAEVVRDVLYLDTRLGGALGLNIVPLGDSPPDFTWRMYYAMRQDGSPYAELDEWTLRQAKSDCGLDDDEGDEHHVLLAHLDAIHPRNHDPDFREQQDFYSDNNSVADARDLVLDAFMKLEEAQRDEFIDFFEFDDYDNRGVVWSGGTLEDLQRLFAAAGMDVEVREA